MAANHNNVKPIKGKLIQQSSTGPPLDGDKLCVEGTARVNNNMLCEK